MKKCINALAYVLSKKNENLKERTFCIINLLAMILGLLGMIETILVSEGEGFAVEILLFFICMVVSMYLVVGHHKLDISSVIMTVAICIFLFPCMFFKCGGIQGGATVYMSLGLAYIFLMYEKKKLAVFLTLDVLINIFCYIIAYIKPELVNEIGTRQGIFIDSLYSVIVVGISVGAMIKLHLNAYEEKREKVEQQKAELEALSSSKDRFLASMTHEIRTPINTIIGLNEMIIRDGSDDTIREYANNVKGASKLLLSLVNDILDLSQMEMGLMDIIPVRYDTKQFILDLVGVIRVQMQRKNLSFLLDIDPGLPSVLYGDRKRINQVLINLLSNASKYTLEGSVTLSIQVEKRVDRKVRLRMSVKDTGIGIRRENLENLYEIFKRIDPDQNQKIEGSGLGLAITKQLVDLMGGVLSVDSIYTKGSTFTVILDQEVIDDTGIGELEIHTTESLADNKERYRHLFEAPEARILVVDDNEMNLVVFEKLLTATRVQVDTARSGEECLEKTQTKYYNIIFMDHMMPGMNGVDVVKVIRRQLNGLCRDSVIIALTANAVLSADTFYAEKGFDSYLEKPIDAAQLEKKIFEYLSPEIIEYHKDGIDMQEGSMLHTVRERRKKKVKITTDCVSDISKQYLEQYDIGMIYLYIKTEMGRFADTIEISSDHLEQYITDEKAMAHADSVHESEYEQFFAQQLTEAEDVIHISMASNSGKSYGVAVRAAKSYDHVHVIDSGQISCGQALLTIHAARLAKDNMPVEYIKEEIVNLSSRIQTQFILSSAKIFYQHGYTTKGMMKLCELLHLHPVLKMKNSTISISGFVRGEMRLARKRFIRRNLGRKKKIDTRAVYATYVSIGVREQNMLEDEIRKCVPFDIVRFQKASFSSACNAGVGAFGFAYYTK